MAREVRAGHGWAVLAFWVLVWEAFCSEGEMLSHGFDRLIVKYPVWPRVVVVLLAAHVGNLIPARFDVFSRVFDFFRLSRFIRSGKGSPGECSAYPDLGLRT